MINFRISEPEQKIFHAPFSTEYRFQIYEKEVTG